MARYAAITDLFILGAPESAFRDASVPGWGFTDEQLEAGLVASCDFVDSYLRGRFTLPLAAFGLDLTRAACIISAYDLLTGRGYNPANQGDDSSQLDKRYESIVSWLKMIARGEVTPVVTDGSEPEGDDDGSPNTPVGGYVMAPRLSDDGDSYVVGAPRPRGW